MTAQELYNQFKTGGRWRTDFGAIFNYQCNTCSPNIPPNFYDSRPAGSSAYTYTGYGKNTSSLDDAWDIYVIAEGGITTTQSADINRLAAEQLLREQAEKDTELAKIAEQLSLKSQMLQSETAVWQSQDAYTQALTDTQKGISVYNSMGKEITTAAQTPLSVSSVPFKPDIGLISIAIVAIILFFLILRK